MIYTFYSYKGGVGRTHLLANLASYLCYYKRRKVLLIDWDLEAPGLHCYFQKNNQPIPTGKGLIDLLQAHIALVQGASETLHENDFVSPFPAYISPITKGKQGGRIDIMPAIDYAREKHQTEVANFEWANFHDNMHGKAYLEWLKIQLKSQYDYVFIDSRTGQNDYSGICNIMMPDMNVFVIAPNTQNFEGAKAMAQRIINSPYIQESKLRKPYILPILSKLDMSVGIQRQTTYLDTFRDAFAFTIEEFLPTDTKPFAQDIAQIVLNKTIQYYNPDFSIGEAVYFDEDTRYNEAIITLKNMENIAKFFLEEMNEKGEIDASKMLDADDWFDIAYKNTDVEKCIFLYKKSLSLDNSNYTTLFNLGLAYFKEKQFNDALLLFEEAININREFRLPYNLLSFIYFSKKNISKANIFMRESEFLRGFEFVNFAHILLTEGKIEDAFNNYKIGFNKFEDKNNFFAEMEYDWQYIAQYGVDRQVFDDIIAQLKAEEAQE